MSVPYTFATQSGNIPLSHLDANFSNVKAYAESAGIVTESSQLNITRVGTLNSLSVAGALNVTGDVTARKYFGDGSSLTGISSQNANAESLTGTTLSANVTQSSLTRLGTLGSLSVLGTTVVGTLTANGAIVSGGVISANTINASIITGTLSTTAQPNITSLGTLIALDVSSNITGGNITTSGVFAGSGARLTNIPGSNVTGSVSLANTANTANTATVAITANTANSAVTAGTVTTGAQPNITSVGTLSSVTATGNVTGGNVVTGGVIQATGNVTGGNIVTVGVVQATGNVSGNYIIGNGSQLTGIVTSSNAALLTGNTLSSNVVNSSLTSVGTLTTLAVTGNVTAGNIVGSGSGTPTVSSTSNLILSAPASVQVTGGGTFRLPNLTSSQISALTPSNGDMVYNTSIGAVQIYANGSWGTVTLS